MTGRPLSLTLATLVSLLPAIPAATQGLERVPPPIDVHVWAKSSSGAPGGAALLVPAGATVTISGTTVPLGAKGTQVRIEIRPPAGAVSTLNAQIAADRSWAIVKTAAKTFDRKEVVSNGEVTVTWTLDVKACNPECQ